MVLSSCYTVYQIKANLVGLDFQAFDGVFKNEYGCLYRFWGEKKQFVVLFKGTEACETLRASDLAAQKMAMSYLLLFSPRWKKKKWLAL